MHKNAGDGSPAMQVEDALRVVPGVVQARVSVGEGDDEGTEVHLVLADDGDEAAIARAVHRMLQLQFGRGLDDDSVALVMASTDPPDEPRRLGAVADTPEDAPHGDELGVEIDVLLAELDRRSGREFHADVLSAAVRHPAGAAPVPEPRSSDDEEPLRLSIARLSVVVDHHRAHATVTLGAPTGEVRGAAEGDASDSSVLESVALATLRAVALLVECEDGFGIGAVSTPRVGDVQVAIVQVECCRHGGVERLTGASEVRDDVHQAVIRATLDAVNRRLAHLSPPA